MPSVAPRVKMISADCAGVEEAGGAGAGGLVGLGGAAAQFVDAAMDVGVVVLVKAAQGVNDGAGLLRGGGVVQIDQRMAVDLLVKNRKIALGRFRGA